MGRSAKTASEHNLNGTPVKVSGVSTVAPGRPRFPSHLCPAARTEYKRACRILQLRGTLTEGDYAMLSVYAEVFARWLEAKKELRDAGLFVGVIVTDNHGVAHKNRRKNPAYEIAVASERQLLSLIRTLGLSPIDKDKPKPAKAPEPVDPMESFLDSAPGPVIVMPKKHGEEPESL
jgi:P27 family predicted phage terminase small subunit